MRERRDKPQAKRLAFGFEGSDTLMRRTILVKVNAPIPFEIKRFAAFLAAPQASIFDSMPRFLRSDFFI